MESKILVITGPTASGKTRATIALAKKINAEVICADSRIVYKGFDIVSAKPDKTEQDGVVHHLIDILEPTEEFSAGDFVKLAEEKIEDIFLRNKNVIISGGTWFYIKSLLAPVRLPECPINKEFRLELSKLDNEALWNELNSLDPVRANQIHKNNRDKVIRSIEMCKALEAPISEYKRAENKNYNALWFMPEIERDELYERINLRVDEIIRQGLYEEWQKNKELYKNSEVIRNTIGYREFFDYEDINIAINKIKQHTRNFAKRQLTYFRSRTDIIKIKNIDDILENLTC